MFSLGVLRHPNDRTTRAGLLVKLRQRRSPAVAGDLACVGRRRDSFGPASRRCASPDGSPTNFNCTLRELRVLPCESHVAGASIAST